MAFQGDFFAIGIIVATNPLAINAH